VATVDWVVATVVWVADVCVVTVAASVALELIAGVAAREVE
jgi:hypothetical protein